MAEAGRNLRPVMAVPRAVGACHRRVVAAYFRALQIGDASRVAPIDKLSVVLVALFGAAFLGERMSTINWIGILLIGCGVVLVALRV